MTSDAKQLSTQYRGDEGPANISLRKGRIILPVDKDQGAPHSTASFTLVPNWVMPILTVVLLALFGFVYTTFTKADGELRDRIAVQEMKMENTREQLIAHGWTVDEQGKIYAPEPKGRGK
jgi:hypothetical protein